MGTLDETLAHILYIFSMRNKHKAYFSIYKTM